jgi:hypothetical protein
MLGQARQILVSELTFAIGVDREQADEILDEVLAGGTPERAKPAKKAAAKKAPAKKAAPKVDADGDGDGAEPVAKKAPAKKAPVKKAAATDA